MLPLDLWRTSKWNDHLATGNSLSSSSFDFTRLLHKPCASRDVIAMSHLIASDPKNCKESLAVVKILAWIGCHGSSTPSAARPQKHASMAWICLVHPKQAIHHSISKFNLQEHTYCWQASHGQDSSPTCGNHEHLSWDPYRMSNFKNFNLKHIPSTFDDIMLWSMHDSMYCITITATPRKSKGKFQMWQEVSNPMCLGLGIVTVALQPTATNIFDMETALPNSDGTHKETMGALHRHKQMNVMMCSMQLCVADWASLSDTNHLTAGRINDQLSWRARASHKTNQTINKHVNASQYAEQFFQTLLSLRREKLTS